VDNAGDVFALIRGVHKTAKGSSIIHAVYRILMRSGTSVYWDFIKSECNIADYFTRMDKEEAGLAWTNTALSPPKCEVMNNIDHNTQSVYLKQLRPQDELPQLWDTVDSTMNSRREQAPDVVMDEEEPYLDERWWQMQEGDDRLRLEHHQP
jgi:hypothetical protein